MALRCVEPRQIIVLFSFGHIDFFLIDSISGLKSLSVMWRSPVCIFRLVSVLGSGTVRRPRCREVLKWPQCLTYWAVQAGVPVRTLLQIPGTHIDMQHNAWFCFGAKCKSAQVFRLSDRTNVGRELVKSKTCLIKTDEGKFFVTKIRVVASGGAGAGAGELIRVIVISGWLHEKDKD